MELALLALAAVLAGFIDAVAGGGGLIQVPALLAALPGESPALVFGTNKVASIFGTGNAAWRYVRRVEVPWMIAVPAALAAFGFSFAGAATVAWFPKDLLRPLVLALLIGVTAYTALKPEFGVGEAQAVAGKRVWLGATLVGSGLGFYDGFFGPGTGSFLIFCFVRFFGLDFLRASTVAKLVNVTTNAAALTFFVGHGQVIWPIGLLMAACNMAGAIAGSHMALKRGSGFVRGAFLLVTCCLILRFAYDIWRG